MWRLVPEHARVASRGRLRMAVTIADAVLGEDIDYRNSRDPAKQACLVFVAVNLIEHFVS
jgi:hypothetical protein